MKCADANWGAGSSWHLSVTIQAVRRVLQWLLARAGDRDRIHVLSRLQEACPPILHISLEGVPLRYYCPSRPAWRRAGYGLRNDPEMLSWIRSFREGEVFWDVGASIGVIAIHAARLAKVQVLAFEPAAPTFAVLCRNIQLNQLENCILAVNLALTDRTVLGILNLPDPRPGAALARFGGIETSVSHAGREFSVRVRHGVVGSSVDGLVERYAAPFPHHMKIDVDGHEGSVLAGATQTLADPRLRSLLVEVDGDDAQIERILAPATRAGLGIVSSRTLRGIPSLREFFLERGAGAS